MRLLPYGDRAVLIELDSVDEVLTWAAAIEAAGLPVLDVVPGARSVFVSTADPSELPAIRSALQTLAPQPLSNDTGELVVVPVIYDGADLADVAAATGLSSAEIVRAHTGTEWRVGFTGFAPGFGYLVDGDARLRVPRRSVPRTRVPAGSVGLADAFSGVYPTDSPGGWQLIGRTDVELFSLHRQPPALLRPGMRVRFEEA